RVAPNVKKLYILLRASDEKSATERFWERTCFEVVKKKYGPNLKLILEKITIVNGDIFLDDLGLHHQDSELEHQMVHQGKNVRMVKHIRVYESNGRNVGRCKKGKYVAGDNSSFDYYQHFQRTILRLDRENQILADMVVNAMLVSMAVRAGRQKEMIYHFSTMVTTYEIHTLCTKPGVKSSLCFEVLKATPEIDRLDFSGLAKYLINYHAQNISDTLKQFKLSRGYIPDIDSEYRLCKELYKDALDKCPYALKYLAAKDYYNFKNMVAQTMGDMTNCIYDDLSTMKPVPQFFITKTNDIHEIGYFIIVFVDCFILNEPIWYGSCINSRDL
ncbi:unnamed protein product, partial [Arabidopsis halleri]